MQVRTLRSGRWVPDIKHSQPKDLSSIISAVRKGPSIDTANAEVVSRERAEPF